MELLTVATNFGIVGVMSLAAGYYIVTRDKQRDIEKERQEVRHGSERKELSDTLIRQHGEALVQAKNSSEALNNNTQVLTEIRTIISNQRNK